MKERVALLAGPVAEGHALARHVPRDLDQDLAPPRRAGRPQVRLHHPRYRRPDPAAEAGDPGREHRRQALARARAGPPDRRLEESRAGAEGRARRRRDGLRQRQGPRLLRALPGALEDPQRHGFRRPAARMRAAVPREPRYPRRIPEALQVPARRRVPGHQHHPVPVASALGARARGGAPESLLRRRRRPVDSTAGAAPRSTTSCASSRILPAPR